MPKRNPIWKQPCSIEGCGSIIGKGFNGMCGKHAMRVKRYGDPNHITSEEVRRARSREAQLANVDFVKPTTYRKLMGRREHRRVAERLMGRPLRRGEIVHHIDGDKHNNDPSNLQVMTQAEHIAIHRDEMLRAQRARSS